jgi:hypothetical protein
VHSIAAALFAKKDQIHFFENIGYRHAPFEHCPTGRIHAQNKCWCDEGNTFGEYISAFIYSRLTNYKITQTMIHILVCIDTTHCGDRAQIDPSGTHERVFLDVLYLDSFGCLCSRQFPRLVSPSATSYYCTILPNRHSCYFASCDLLVATHLCYYMAGKFSK